MVWCIISWLTLDKKGEIILNSLDTFITKNGFNELFFRNRSKFIHNEKH